MTVVLSFATSDYVLMAADKRRTNIEDTNEFYDDMQKFYRVNDFVMVGFSGDYDVTIDCLYFLKENDFKKATVQAITRKLRRYLRNKYKKNNELQQTFIAAGVGDGEKMTIMSTNERDNFNLEMIVPDPGHIKYQTAFPDASVDPCDYIEKSFKEVTEKGEVLTLDTLKQIVAETIHFVSKDSKYVSPACSIDFIKKEIERKNNGD